MLFRSVDDSDNKQIQAYVLDLCAPEGINEQQIVEIAADWYETSKDRYPISFEFSKLGLSKVTEIIYRKYDIEHVTRVIGPLPSFNMNTPPTIKRRRRKPIPDGLEINTNGLSLD